MIRLELNLIWSGCAEGKYIVRAKGCILAALRWGDCGGPDDGWSPIAYVPVDPAGNGVFFFSGRRGIPPGITHVWARCYAADFTSFEDASAKIPERFLLREATGAVIGRFSVLTDLHMTTKPWKIRQALRAVQSDVVFLLGDSTNDGLPEQFGRFRACIEELAPDRPFFPVPGNHDVLHERHSAGGDGCRNYADFQKHLLSRSEVRGFQVEYAPDGRAYAVKIGGLDVIGLQCVTTGCKFLFDDAQIDWLEERLAASEARWRIVLCHGPMLKHNPNRSDGPPYLSHNRRLQEMLDRYGRVIFLSGHTHVSPNVPGGSGEFDREHGNIYLDCASVVPTDTAGETGMMAPDWKDGCRTELTIMENAIEIRMGSVESGICFPRGYYWFEDRRV